MLTFEISPQDHCRRLESYLHTLMPAATSSYIRKLIKSGAAKLDGAPATADTMLAVNSTVTLKESTATVALISAVRPSLDILFEDEKILIANKPHGLSVHSAAECVNNLVDDGQVYLEQRATPCKLYPVNRLDRGTSGTVVLAKSSAAAGIYGRQIHESGLDKLYLALVHGFPKSAGTVREPLDGKESETRYEVLLTGTSCSLLAVIPLSGRTHQIRRHLAAIGYPVIADKRYGGGDLPEISGFALHSFRTSLTLANSEHLSLCAPISHEILTLCEQQGIERAALLDSVYRLAHTAPPGTDQ